jgi:hypothetical protein
MMFMSLLAIALQAQNTDLEDWNKFRVSLGVDVFKTVDFQYSPNMYKSTRPSLQLAFSNRFKKGIFSTYLDIFMGPMSPNSGKNNTVYISETDIYGTETVEGTELIQFQMSATIDLGYVHYIQKLSSARTKTYLGGSISEHQTFAPGLISIGTISYASLNARSRMDYTLSNGRPITIGLSVPLLSIVTRLPYHNAPAIPGKSDFETFFTDHNYLETLDHFQNFECSVGYNILVRPKRTLDLNYKLSWMHYNRPENITRFGSQLSLGLNF